MIDFLVPAGTKESMEDALGRVVSSPCGLPFNDLVVDFVATLSRSMLADPGFREHPELLAMAHWFRRSSLNELRGQYFATDKDRSHIRLRRGTVFHIAPSNVDSVFIYSWLLSLLCGNANIARVSKRRTAQMAMFFSFVNDLLSRDVYRPLADANLVVSYDHDAQMTGRLSSLCQLRVIWGGDATIEQIRAIPLPPLSSDLAFANRFSMAVIRSGAVLGLDEAGLRTLGQGFYNDAFWFNQQACSSPRVVVWVGGGDENERARAIFWPAVQTHIQRMAPENLPAQVMDRATTLFRFAHQHPEAKAETAPGAMPSRVLVQTLTEADRSCHDGNGLFLELDRAELQDMVPLLAPRDQTIAHFGFAREDWLPLLGRLPPHAADRIVPVGTALAFNPVWDGINLLYAFTRELAV